MKLLVCIIALILLPTGHDFLIFMAGFVVDYVVRKGQS